MQDLEITNKAQNIRDVIRYIEQFKNATIVIYIDDEIINSSLFSSHIQDISLLHQAGLKIVIIPAARKRIDQILSESKINWEYKNNIRITDETAIPQIKMAAFDVSNIVMTKLAAHQITATIGNWVHARAKGVIDGIDFGTAGEIDKLQIDALKSTLSNGFIPIFPCIGWNSTGKPYNISSINLAEQIAVELNADKLFFLMKDEETIAPALNLEELEEFLKKNSSLNEKTKLLLKTAGRACKNGVTRSHILNGMIDGTLLCEIFSEIGSGTMIYSSGYGKIRAMIPQDIPAVLSVMRPFIKKQILLPRTEQNILEQIQDFIVYEIDGSIHACAALHIYNNEQAEIAALAVDDSSKNLGIGVKLVENLLEQAKSKKIKSVFILTTQTADWFEKLGFISIEIKSLPYERQKKWSPERNSKAYSISFSS